MAFSSKQMKMLSLTVLLTWTIVSMTVQARPLASSSTLAARLQFEDSYKCWESLTELRACTGEVILFFFNGETYLGPGCCRAIRIIEHICCLPCLVHLASPTRKAMYSETIVTPQSLVLHRLHHHHQLLNPMK
ncbi:hypothetical protein IFM89_006866 [Coptis chinensis]|uniref:Prolamin-like domain-containing protein n=1 Tax=Coptis chinensis TaxID=261450 RepID=A0A835GXK3_9MAGN|nr:hypothetical protein IFM89_006866 [Coptis chinensis]